MRTRFVKISSIETGLVATVSGASWSKIMSRSAIERSFSSQAHFQAMGNLDTLFRLATRVEQRPGDKPNDETSLRAVYQFMVPMPLDEQTVLVRITAKEYREASQGVRLYVVQAVDIEEPASIGGSTTSPQHATSPVSVPPAGLTPRLRQMVAAVKGERRLPRHRHQRGAARGVSRSTRAKGRLSSVFSQAVKI